MNDAVKIIIIGFALMFFGGIIFATASIGKINMPLILSLLSYGYFLGLILIVIGVIIHPKKQ